MAILNQQGMAPVARAAHAGSRRAAGRWQRLRVAAAGMVALVCALAAGPVRAQAGVVFEDYAGPNYSGSAPLPASVPTFSNPNLTGSGGLLPLHQNNPANAVRRSGTEDTLDWPENAPRLCADYGVGSGTPSAVAACQLRVMGRVAYAVVRMPVAGNIGFYIAHDDNARVDLSSDYNRPASYRTAAWDLPVGALSSYTDNGETFARIGSVNSPREGSCLLLRLAWANAGGRNYMRLAYRTTTTGPNQFFSAAQLINPTDTARINSLCQGAVEAAPTIQLVKQIPGGRATPADQFTLAVRQGGTVLSTGTTSGSASSLTLPAVTVTTSSGGSGETVVIEEQASNGGSLSVYQSTASCTVSGSNTPVALTRADSGSVRRWQLPMLAAGSNVVCTIVNARSQSSLALTKTSTPQAPWRNGQTVSYVLSARNNGPDAADGARLRDPAVPGVSCSTIACSASNGAQCPGAVDLTLAGLQGAGLTLPVLPNGGVVTVTLQCEVTASGF